MTTPKLSKGPKSDDEASLEARTSFSGDNAGPTNLSGYFHAYVDKVRGGDVGALPAALGLVVLIAVFWAAKPTDFMTVYNLGNLLQQSGSICVLAMGIGFVLLLGHIDLSAGVIGGVAAGVMAQLLVLHSWSWYWAVLAALVVGVLMGLLTGWLVTVVGIPSFVVTLAFFLAWQGLLLVVMGQSGTVSVGDSVIVAIDGGNMPVTVGWIVVILSIVAYAGINLIVWQRRTAHHLITTPLVVVVIRIVVIAVVLVAATIALSTNRGLNNADLAGIPWIAPIVGVLLVVLTFVQHRTAFGRYVYAVGGNAEAARRAGIRVGRITIYCFVLSSAMAAFSGIIDSSRIGSVSSSSGGGNVLLFAVAAAVIGGTSLFGGKGKAKDAILGGLVIGIINNGLGLLGVETKINYIITGIVLLLAASVDALSRRRRAGSAR
ncbi:sugar ABC transporter permease [Nakamurella sp. PAMC28650]|uniref:sugar ABC transporter permease n=1 Tax=Nakamurella sp. PAMC28650 TaxID=2762325 RepID=UPI00164E6E3C|nr:ABC transporter permease [Nakamurella sp. PAMC28650]QNK82282.1 ABC transporter permease [Nakamurella sp. PAMC28650]